MLRRLGWRVGADSDVSHSYGGVYGNGSRHPEVSSLTHSLEGLGCSESRVNDLSWFRDRESQIRVRLLRAQVRYSGASVWAAV